MDAHIEEILAQIDTWRIAVDAKAKELTAAIKAQVATGDHNRADDKIIQIVKEWRKLRAGYLRQVRALQRSAGVTEAQIRAIERAEEEAQLPRGEELWRDQIVREVRPTEDLDRLATTGLTQLLSIVDANWLEEQAKRPYRLGSSFLSNPLHIVNGIRVGMAVQEAVPQRFAQMLLVTQDHLARRDNLDFFSAATFVPEIAILGNSLDEIAALGAEAQHKLTKLGTVPDDIVTSTIFELLVGASCVRRGLTLQMVPETRSGKVPDFRVTGIGPIPGAIECKRRLGLTEYELREAEHIESLYHAVEGQLKARGVHGSIEASFAIEVSSVSPSAFCQDVVTVVNVDQDQETTLTSWGSLAFRRLPYYDDLPRTRLYSPEFLQRTFRWEPVQNEWDGLLCEVEAPLSIMVKSFRAPLCLKWRSEHNKALAKKSRGITSLWGEAIKQIPPGEIGFVYIAYPEGSRSELADARTRDILRTMADSWHHWYIRVPLCVVSRLYPRSLHEGRPDLIENVLPGAAKGQEFWLTKFPWMIFTRQSN